VRKRQLAATGSCDSVTITELEFTLISGNDSSDIFLLNSLKDSWVILACNITQIVYH